MESRSKVDNNDNLQRIQKSICEYDDRTDQYVGDEIKKRKSKVVVNATDDRRMITGKSNFTMPHHTE